METGSSWKKQYVLSGKQADHIRGGAGNVTLMETVAFYSYKGGVGRTLLLTNTARFLAMSGKKVVALDLDFEAPGLHYKLGIEGRVKTGAVDIILQGLKGEAPESIREAFVEVTLPTHQDGKLWVLPAGPAPLLQYWASLTQLQQILIERQGDGLLEAVLDLQMRIEEELSPDILLVDARTGVTELGGFATTALSDRVVLITAMNRESLDGIKAVAEALDRTPVLGDKPGRRLHFVAARAHGTESFDKEKLDELFGDCFILPNDPFDGATERGIGSTGAAWPEGEKSRRDESKSLLARMLEWIGAIFPTDAAEADLARRRMIAVNTVRRILTQKKRLVDQLSDGRDPWDSQLLSTNVRVVDSSDGARIADIEARLHPENAPVMIVEYVDVDDEARGRVAKWWFDFTPARVVVLLFGNSGECSIYSRRDYENGRCRPT